MNREMRIRGMLRSLEGTRISGGYLESFIDLDRVRFILGMLRRGNVDRGEWRVLLRGIYRDIDFNWYYDRWRLYGREYKPVYVGGLVMSYFEYRVRKIVGWEELLQKVMLKN